MGVLEDLRSVAYTLARFAGFSANAFLFGLVPIALLVLRPAFRRLDGDEWAAGRRRIGSRLEGLVQASLIASATATAIALLLQAVLVAQLNRQRLDFDSFTSSLNTSFGQWYLLRFPLLAGLAFLVVGKVRRSVLAGAGGDERPPGAVWWGGWGAFGLALLATNSFSGHAAVAEPRGLALLNDVIHLASGAIWFAGIIVLAVVLPDGWRGKDSATRVRLLAPVVVRFSKVALASITVVAITGTVNSLLDVNALNDLVDTGYGRTLALKIGLFLMILVLGGINHFFLRARLERASEASEATGAQRLFRKTIAAELTIAIGLMGMTGVLVGQARTKESVVVRPPVADLSSSRRP
jgi:putative copper export protein